MDKSWIKLYRDLLDSEIFSSEKGLKVWIWCLLKANHEETTFFVGMQKVELLEGQFIFGRKKASEELHMSPTTVVNWMRTLKQDSYLDIKTTNKYSVITIKKWNEFQKMDNKLYNRKTTERQQKDTYKNDKNDKKYNNTNVLLATEPVSITTNYLLSLFKDVNPSYERLFPNKGQRAAIERMVEKHGNEKIEQVIKSLVMVIGKPYAPVITTPYELEQKLGSLIAFMQKDQLAINKFSVTKVL